MASRRTQEFPEESDNETEDEDYEPDEEVSEEEYLEVEIAPPEWPEIETAVIPSAAVHVTEEWGDGEGDGEDDDDRNPVTETSFSTSGGNEGQFGTCSDSACLPSCPICFIPWTSDGPHRVCCIPCGHVYGRSCLERWINQLKKTTAKCPQCSARFKKNELINLYAPIIAVPNTDLEKEVLLLREKNESLKVERDLLMEEINRAKKMSCLEASSTGALKRSSMHFNEGLISAEPLLENNLKSQHDLNINGSSHHRCVLQNELPVDGARVLGIDASSQILIVSGKKTGSGGEHILSKISLLGRHEFDQIQLPPRTGAVRDLCILPGNLAVIASLGKKISVLSMLSNNIVLKYDLPVPAWSCSGDVNEPYHIYAGLQNGMLMMFDIRQTARWLESIDGLSRFPIHTICSLQQNYCSRKVLTASSAGPCLWDTSGCGERPLLIPGLENQGICISLATGGSNGEIVASFRPKIELPCDVAPSQSPVSPSQPIYSAGKLGSHVNIKTINGTNFQIARAVSGYVSEVRMSKSAIICPERNNPLFAFGDESTHGACMWDLPSFQVHSRHRPHQYPILDLKYSSSGSSGFLGCLSVGWHCSCTPVPLHMFDSAPQQSLSTINVMLV